MLALLEDVASLCFSLSFIFLCLTWHVNSFNTQNELEDYIAFSCKIWSDFNKGNTRKELVDRNAKCVFFDNLGKPRTCVNLSV